MHKKANRFPIGNVFGFLLSLALTFGAAAVALRTPLPVPTIMWIIGTMAVIQAALQLFMFMHVGEGEDRRAQIINIAYGIFMAIVIVLGSIWVMSFDTHVH